MKHLLKYIVLSVLCFNISVVKSAEVTYEFAPDETPVENTDFKGAVNLPHPADMSRIVNNADGTIAAVAIIGGYFNFKYPGEAINSDFSEDVEQMFPQLDSAGVSTSTRLIKYGVRFFRWGMEKYNEIKEKMLVPPEPPLIVEENEYSLPEEYTYVDAGDNNFAIKYDFKKVVPYSNNPRDIEAMRAKSQRDIDSKEHKTDFDQFKSMVDKIELKKIPFYGFSEPNPLIGNAGTSPWQNKDGFYERILTEMEEYADASDFLGGIHLSVPGHRFILANTISDTLQKPQITLTDSQNVKNFEVFYPSSQAMISDEMIDAYTGNFLIPLRITPEHAHQPVAFSVNVTFYSCDKRLDCVPVTFNDKVWIDAADLNNYSSFQNFVEQSYYNLPQSENKNFSLLKAYAKTADGGEKVESLQFVFEYDNDIKNFHLLVEDEQSTRFKAAKISIDADKIYATVIPLNNAQKLLHETVTVTARLNNFDNIRKTLQISTPQNDSGIAELPVTEIFLAGLLMSLTPLGLFIFCMVFRGGRKQVNISARKTIYGILSGSLAACGLLAYLQQRGITLYWGMQYQSVFYMAAAFVVFWILKHAVERPHFMHRVFCRNAGLWAGVLLIFAAPVAFVPYLKVNLFNAYVSSLNRLTVFMCAFTLGCVLPYVIGKFIKLRLSAKHTNTIKPWLNWMMWLQIAVMLIIFLTQYDIFAALKAGTALLFLFICVQFLFAFDNSTQRVALTGKMKRNTEITLAVLGLLLTLLTAYLVPQIKTSASSAAVNQFNRDAIEQKIRDGYMVMVRFDSAWCPVCRINDILVFNSENINKWKQNFKIDFITVNATHPSPETLDIYRKFNRASPPLYILYDYQLENGLVIRPLLTDREFESILQRFSFTG